MDELFSVNNVCVSMQGEGPYIGRKTIFVRMQGCNLNCQFCDTKKAQKNIGGNKFHAEEIGDIIFAKMKHFHCNYVVFTGGEPLLQPIHLIIKYLQTCHVNRDPFFVGIETNGTQSLEKLYPYNCLISLSISPKVSRDKMKINEGELYFRHSALKLIYPYLPGCQPKDFEDYPVMRKGFHPIHSKLMRDRDEVIREFFSLKPDWYLSLQVHKFLNID